MEVLSSEILLFFNFQYFQNKVFCRYVCVQTHMHALNRAFPYRTFNMNKKFKSILES